MRILFTRACECSSERAALPAPSFHTKAPSQKNPEAIVDLDLKCPICGTSWIASIAVKVPMPLTRDPPKLDAARTLNDITSRMKKP